MKLWIFILSCVISLKSHSQCDSVEFYLLKYRNSIFNRWILIDSLEGNPHYQLSFYVDDRRNQIQVSGHCNAKKFVMKYNALIGLDRDNTLMLTFLSVDDEAVTVLKKNWYFRNSNDKIFLHFADGVNFFTTIDENWIEIERQE